MNIKYYKLKRQYSENGGVTWLDLGAYKVGDVVETNSSCETDAEQVLTREIQLSVDDAYTCDGYDKRYIISHQQSTDGGIIWTETHQTIGDVAEINSVDCGYAEQVLTREVQLSVDEAYTCDGYDKRYIISHQQSTDGGIIWTETHQTIGDVAIPNSTYCGYAECDVIAKYNITDGGMTQKIINWPYSDYVSEIYVDDIKVSTFSSYTFSTTGEHIVRYRLTHCTSMGSSVFSGCKMVSVEIPNSVIGIGDGAFYNCDRLTSITIPDSVTRISDSAFFDCDALTSVKIGSGVNSIGDDAFNGCGSLTSITCNAIIAPVIRDETFSYIPNDYIVYHPCESDYYTWSGSSRCIKDDMNIYTTIKCKYNILTTTEATKIINNLNNISHIHIDGVQVSTLTSHTFSTTGEHTVNFTLKDNTLLSNKQFSGCTSLTSVTLPNSITTIGNEAFNYCSGLTSINIPSGATSIGNDAFNYCTSLTSIINIPDSVKTIGTSAFDYCSSLPSITIGSGVTSIGQNAFANCSGLTSITCNAIIAPEQKLGIFRNLSKGTLYYPCGSDYSSWMRWLDDDGWTAECFEGADTSRGELIARYYITSSDSRTVKILGDTENIFEMYVDGVKTTVSTGHTFSTFGEHNVRFVLRDKTTIGTSAFTNCVKLTSVTIPDSVNSIGYCAFQKCSGLTSITLPDNVKTIYEYAFQYCTSLTSINIPSGVTKIVHYTFSSCWRLTSITIPNSVKTIGSGAFAYCSRLASITIGSGVTSIGHSAFYGCSKLNSITSNATTAPRIKSSTFQDICVSGKLYFPSGSDYSKWLSTSTYYLGYYGWVDSNQYDILDKSLNGYDVVCVYNISPTTAQQIYSGSTFGLMSIDGGEDITATSSYTFSTTGLHVVRYRLADGVNGLNNSIFRNDVTLLYCELGNSVTNIGDYAFRSCNNLRSIIIPNSVTSLGQSVFKSCGGLTSITIPDSVTSIGNNAFDSCLRLTSITIPNSVTNIGVSAFTNCNSLRSINIPSDVTSISQYAFYNCSGLTSITIPSGVTSIGDYAFYGCSKLNSITCKAITAPARGSNTFAKVAKNGTLYYPSGSDYSSWLSNDEYYLGYYGWTGQEI